MEKENDYFEKRYLIARKFLYLTQNDISKETGLTTVKISNFETGRKKTPYSEYTDFLISKGISLDWLLYGNGEMLQTKEVSNIESDTNNSLELERINKEQEKIIEQQGKLIQSQSSIIQKMESRLTKVQDQMDNLNTTFNNFMTLVMASGMQLLPKQQIVGQQQQDFNTAGVSSQFLVANIMIEYYLKALKVG